ncbi:MAG: hypothetical protein LBQ61_06100, partial [Spirochaetales bacterium]|nr:hypothetical protein [Spirochaetales bacterium]
MKNFFARLGRLVVNFSRVLQYTCSPKLSRGIFQDKRIGIFNHELWNDRKNERKERVGKKSRRRKVNPAGRRL